MATTIATLKAMIVADASGLVDGLALTKREIREAQKLSDSLQSRNDRFAGRARQLGQFAAAGQLGPEEQALAMARLRTEYAASLPIIGGIAQRFTAANVAAVALAGTTATLAGTFATAVSVTMQQATALDDLGDAAERLGVGASALSAIRTAGFLADVESGQVDAMLQKMLVSLGKGADVFDDLGLSVEALKSQSPVEAFRQISEAIQGLPTQSDRLAAIQEVFGKSGPEGAALVAKYSEAMDAALSSGAVASQELVDQAGRIDELWKSISTSTEGWKNTLFQAAGGQAEGFLSFVDTFLKNPGRTLEFTIGMGRPVETDFTEWLKNTFEAPRDALAEQAKRDAAKQLGDLESILDVQHDIVDATKEQAKQDEAALATIEKLREEYQAIFERTGIAEVDAANAARRDQAAKGASQAAQEEAAALARLISLKKQQLDFEREIARETSRNAIRDIERGQSLERSLMTPAETARQRFIDDLDALKKSGLDSPDLRERLIRRSARDIMAGEAGGTFGAPSADKGTRAAREAIIGAQFQAEQLQVFRRMETLLRRLADKEAITVEEISE